MSERHWFADIDPEHPDECRWQPCLETQTGIIPSLPIWFPSKEACDDWIKDNIVGAGWQP